MGPNPASAACCSQQLLLELCLHLASVNRAPGEMQSNPEALVVWFQELYSRAYALQVVARYGMQPPRGGRSMFAKPGRQSGGTIAWPSLLLE